MPDTIHSNDVPSGVGTPDEKQHLVSVAEEFLKASGLDNRGQPVAKEVAKAPEATKAAPEPAKAPETPPEKPAAPEPSKDKKSPFQLPKKDAAPPADPDAPDFVKGKSEKSAQWAALKAEKEAALAKAQQVEATYKAQLEKIQKERDEYAQTLRLSSAENAPEVKALAASVTRAQAEIKKAAGEHGDKLAELAALPDSAWKDAQIADVISELSDIQKGQVAYRLAQIKDLSDAKAATLQKIAAERDGLVVNETARIEASKQEAEKLFSTVAEEATAHLDILQAVEGNNDHNSRVSEILDTAKNLFMGSMDTKEVATASVWAAMAPHLYQQRTLLMQENAALRKQLDGLKAATPGATSSAKGADSSGGPKGFVESIMAEIQR